LARAPQEEARRPPEVRPYAPRRAHHAPLPGGDAVTAKNVSNLAASVQARLQNHARVTKRPFQELLQYYAMERFLYRLSTTPHSKRFVLKGALMLHVWKAPLARATKDVDFLGRIDNSLENLERVVREICTAD